MLTEPASKVAVPLEVVILNLAKEPVIVFVPPPAKAYQPPLWFKVPICEADHTFVDASSNDRVNTLP